MHWDMLFGTAIRLRTGMATSSKRFRSRHRLSNLRNSGMTHNNDPSDDVFRIDEPTPPLLPGAGELFSWIFPAVGLFVIEQFANPGVGISIACLKFSYRDFRTACWLRWDPIHSRGAAHSPLYCMRGCLVCVFWSVLLLLLFGLFEGVIIRNNPFAVFESIMIACLVISFTGIFLGQIIGLIGFYRVNQLSESMWMDSTIHQARRKNRWDSVCRGTWNEFPYLCLLMVMSGIVWCTGGIAAGWHGFHDPQHARDPVLQRVFVSLMVTMMISAPGFYGLMAGWRAWRHSAKTADDVWPA